jgi:hypothetical protein
MSVMVTARVVVQVIPPDNKEYIIVVEPAATADKIPEVEPIVATLVLELVHVPIPPAVAPLTVKVGEVVEAFQLYPVEGLMVPAELTVMTM